MMATKMQDTVIAVVFRDRAFGGGVAKTNHLTAIFQRSGLDNVRSL